MALLCRNRLGRTEIQIRPDAAIIIFAIADQRRIRQRVAGEQHPAPADMSEDDIGRIAVFQAFHQPCNRLARPQMIFGGGERGMPRRRLLHRIDELADARLLLRRAFRDQRDLVTLGDEARDQSSELTRSCAMNE